MFTRILLAITIVLSVPAVDATAAERVIFDTDIGGDIDDAGTMAVMHALADRGEIEILAVGIVNGHVNAVPYTDAINTWYGRPNLPVGIIKRDAPINRDKYMAEVVKSYPHDLTNRAAPDVIDLYRQILAAQPDRSVTLIAVGPPTNISRLLDSSADEHSPLDGVGLMRRKVKFYAAGGNGNGGLPKGQCGWNYQQDIPAGQNELAKLPVDFPTVFAGGSGNRLKIGTCYRDAPSEHIIRKSYEAYFGGQADMNRPTWDQLRMLYGARPSSRRLFDTSASGSIRLDDRGILSWTASPDRNVAYAYVDDLEAMRTEITMLMMHVPVGASSG
ncbi:MAG: nucleoside hydrolase [Pirellulaceae bacterium]|nr:nucleoside hydrolase [Pirellulaceae bacterium]